MKLFPCRKRFTNARLSKPAPMLLFVPVSILFAVCGLLAWEAGIIYRSAEQTLEKERRKLSKQNAVSFPRVILKPRFDQNIQLIQNTKHARSLAGFQNSVFAATDGGLLQLSADGATARHFTVRDGLPESDLTTLEVYGERILIGTRSKGLVNFDGEKFESLSLENHPTK